MLLIHDLISWNTPTPAYDPERMLLFTCDSTYWHRALPALTSWNWVHTFFSFHKFFIAIWKIILLFGLLNRGYNSFPFLLFVFVEPHFLILLQGSRVPAESIAAQDGWNAARDRTQPASQMAPSAFSWAFNIPTSMSCPTPGHKESQTGIVLTEQDWINPNNPSPLLFVPSRKEKTRLHHGVQ